MNLFLIRASWSLMLLLAGVVFVYAALVYLPFNFDRAPEDLRDSFEARPWGIYTHIFGSMLAIILGPFQFLTNLRVRHPKLHRVLGRLYLLGILVGGVAGVYVAFYAFGGLVSRYGFASLAVLWLFTGFIALRFILHHNVAAHRQWMIRNYALTLAAVTLRLWLGIFLAIGFAFEDIYPLIAWLCWVPNLIVAEWIVRNTKLPNSRRPTSTVIKSA